MKSVNRYIVNRESDHRDVDSRFTILDSRT